MEREVFGAGRAIGEHKPQGAEGAAADGDGPASQVVPTARSLGAIGGCPDGGSAGAPPVVRLIARGPRDDPRG